LVFRGMLMNVLVEHCFGFFFHSNGDQSSTMQVLVALISPEACLLDYRCFSAFSMCPLMAFPVCREPWWQNCSLFDLIRTPLRLGLGPLWWLHFTSLFTGYISKCSHILRSKGLEVQHMNKGHIKLIKVTFCILANIPKLLLLKIFNLILL
jgi:hypothetical protein